MLQSPSLFLPTNEAFMTLCIIPARGGSKRIPRKNIRPFNGKPMIAHSILAARSAGCFEQIIVSTDDDEIAQIAQQYGEAEFDDWPRWQRACQAWQAEQKRSMH